MLNIMKKERVKYTLKDVQMSFHNNDLCDDFTHSGKNYLKKIII